MSPSEMDNLAQMLVTGGEDGNLAGALLLDIDVCYWREIYERAWKKTWYAEKDPTLEPEPQFYTIWVRVHLKDYLCELGDYSYKIKEALDYDEARTRELIEHVSIQEP